MWRLWQVFQFIGFLLHAKRPEQVHSPFLFNLLPFIHDKSRHYYVYDVIEHERVQLLKNHDAVEEVDFGAGSKVDGRRSIRDIAKTSLSSPVKCQTIFRLIVHQQPQIILELGTALGIMSAYLASAHSAQVHTMEGNPALSSIAQGIASRLELKNVIAYQGRFQDTLPKFLAYHKSLDFVLIDGDHRGSALKTYLNMIKPHLSKNAIVMIDDIRWSADMFDVWKQIIQDPQVTCSLDYFTFGLLFFRTDFRDKVNLKILPERKMFNF